MMSDTWTPPNCKHGARPIVEQEFIEFDTGYGYLERMPARKSLYYDCPSPYECVGAAIQDGYLRQAEQLLTGQEP